METEEALIQLLVVRTPGGRTTDFHIHSSRVSIGRDELCDLTIDSHYVSKNHALIERRGKDVHITDQNSRNGTLVNGQRIERQLLASGDEIQVGDCIVTYVERPTGPDVTEVYIRSPEAAGSGGFRLDVERWEVDVPGREVPKLSLQEFTFLSLLYSRGGRVVSRDDLGDAIWGQGLYDYNLLHRLVHRVKEKVEPDPKKPEYVQSVPGVGYKLVAGGLSNERKNMEQLD